MEFFRAIRSFLVAHWLEIILAVLFAFIFDIAGMRPRFKLFIRRFANWISQVSVASMRLRIARLERQQQRVTKYLQFEEVAYRRLWGQTIIMLIYLGFGLGSFLILFFLYIRDPAAVFPDGWFFFGVGLCGCVAAIATGYMAFYDMWEDRSELEEQGAKLKTEIDTLREKVKSRTRESS